MAKPKIRKIKFYDKKIPLRFITSKVVGKPIKVEFYTKKGDKVYFKGYKTFLKNV